MGIVNSQSVKAGWIVREFLENDEEQHPNTKHNNVNSQNINPPQSVDSPNKGKFNIKSTDLEPNTDIIVAIDMQPVVLILF